MESSRIPRAESGSYLPKVGLLERVGLRDMDGWLAFSALGLLVCSIYTLSQTSAQVVPGAPDYFPQRQAVYLSLIHI